MIAEAYRLLPIKGGQTRLSFNPVVNRLMKDMTDPVSARLLDGSRIEVDPQDYHGRILYLFGTNDIKVSLNTTCFLSEGDVFLDIGANYSTIGLQASHAVGRSGAVHLFEPQSRIADRVEAAIAAGGYANVVLHRCGLMDRESTLTIRAPAAHSGRATFASHGEASEFERSEVCAVHEIGAYVSPLVEARPFGVKLDIEGSEPRVMPWLLAQPNLKFLIFEANHHIEDLFDLVRRSGLTLFGLERKAVQLRLGRVDAVEQMRGYHDMIALRLRPGASVDPHSRPRDLVKLMARDAAGSSATS